MTEYMDFSLSLLDRLANDVGCTYLSDLKYLSDTKKTMLIHELEMEPPIAASLSEWNDALIYLGQGPPQCACTAARQRLIDCLLLPTPDK